MAFINRIVGNGGGRFENLDPASLLMGINIGNHNKAQEIAIIIKGMFAGVAAPH